MFDGAADAANYQMKMFLGSQYVRMQTSLSVASDDIDNATNGNVENLKAAPGTPHVHLKFKFHYNKSLYS
jgi:hypothetical protein